jgi:hypothetical protein
VLVAAKREWRDAPNRTVPVAFAGAIMRVKLILLLLIALAHVAAAQQLPSVSPDTHASDGFSGRIEDYGKHDRTCLIWVDGRRTCRRTSNDQANCSNIGVAAVGAKPIECVVRATDDAKQGDATKR